MTLFSSMSYPGSDSVMLLYDVLSLCILGHRYVPKVLSRTRKPKHEEVRVRVDHKELSYDSKNRTYHVLLYILHSISSNCYNCLI
jgi:hypothetical protein